jgi:hypothetical protein
MCFWPIAPRAAFRMLLGESRRARSPLLVARNWAWLVGASGAMLVWGAFTGGPHPRAAGLRAPASSPSSCWLLSHTPYRRKAIAAIVIDGLLVALFAAYCWA